MERMAHNMGRNTGNRSNVVRRINGRIYKRKYKVMEAKKLFKVKVSERIFKIEAHSKYHAIDKVYTAYCVFERDRSKYKIVK